MTFLRCAQECAHRLVAIGILTIEELIATQDIRGKATVFNRRHRKVALAKNSSGSHVLARLQTRGEVAEWPKAAVC